MGGNKDNMRQAMKELLGLVGFGPEETVEAKAAAPERAKAVEHPAAPETPKTPERPVVQQPRIEREPAVIQQPKIEREPAVAQQPKIEREPAVERRETVRPAEPVHRAPEVKAPEIELEETRQKVASAVERSFFSFGKPKAKEPEPSYERAYAPSAAERLAGQEYPLTGEDTIQPPFIRPGATVIAAGATFFGDIRAEGDVEVLGKVKGNLEATGNVRVLGKVLGDVKGEAVMLKGCTVQGNITSTSYVSLDAGAMVVGDVLATDFESDGKVKGNLQIARAATFSSCALLAGNVIAATIMMAQGAKVQGAVRIAEDPEANALFGELEI